MKLNQICEMGMFHRTALATILCTLCCLPAQARVLIQVDQSSQRMEVTVDGLPTYDWRVSTGKPGYETPNGSFRPNRLDADHHSVEYDGAPMPFAIFFDLNGHAIHGTYEKVGVPGASHGCVRLEPANARRLFDLVQKQGLGNVSVEIGGDVMMAMRNVKNKKSKVARRAVNTRGIQAQAAPTYGRDPAILYESTMPLPVYPAERQWGSSW